MMRVPRLLTMVRVMAVHRAAVHSRGILLAQQCEQRQRARLQRQPAEQEDQQGLFQDPSHKRASIRTAARRVTRETAAPEKSSRAGGAQKKIRKPMLTRGSPCGTGAGTGT